jgi:hypothetical protein
MGHWIGVNRDLTIGDASTLLSLTEQIKAGAKTEAVHGWEV